MQYSEEVLRRVRQLERVGAIDGEHVGTGEVGTLDDGTVVRIQVRRDGERIAEARFKVLGCSAAIASASLVAEWLEGSPLAAAEAITADRVAGTLALAPERHQMAAMAVEAARRAVMNLQ
jgi:NifU-like protein involved in Fe-S cluster formation